MSTNVALAKLFERAKDSSSNQSTIEPENEEKGHIKCPHHFGYLAEHPKKAPFPEECLLCSKVVECIVQNSK
jgi:hypothetical protein